MKKSLTFYRMLCFVLLGLIQYAAGQDTIINSTENDDTIGTANATGLVGGDSKSVIGRGVTGDGAHGVTTGDFDFYGLQANAGQSLRVNVEAFTIGRTTDTVVGVYDATGTLLASNDDEGGGIAFDSFLDFVIPSNGTYYVAVGTWVTGAADANLPADPLTAGTGPGVAAGGFDNYDVYISLDIPVDMTLTGAVFPATSPNTPAMATLVITNRGESGNLNITGTSFSGPQAALFSLTPPVGGFVAIAPGGSVNVTVNFNPNGFEGTAIATLEVASNDSNASTRIDIFTAIALPLPETRHTTVAYYPMGEIPGNFPLVDISGNNNNYTNVFPGPAAASTDVSARAAAKLSSTASRNFAGAGYWIQTPNASFITALTGPDIGVETWVKTSNPLENAYIAGTGHQTSGFGFSISGGSWVAIGDDGTFILGPTIVNDEWTHLALVLENGTHLSFYVNGQIQGGAQPVFLFNTDPRPHLTVNSGGGTVFDGHLDALHYFTFATGKFDVNELLLNIENGPRFRIQSVTENTMTNEITVTWASLPGRIYALTAGSNLTSWPTTINGSVASGGNTTQLTFPKPAVGKMFYRIQDVTNIGP